MRAVGRGHVFSDRRAAGVELAREVRRHALRAPLLLLGLPRGGVPIAAEIADALHAPLDVMVVRKIGMPGQPELAVGAIASGGLVVRDPHSAIHLPEETFRLLAAREREELERREHVYRAGRPPLALRGKTVVLVDDGLATGSTMLAAVRAVRQAGAAAVVVAAPVASHQAVKLVSEEVDAVIVLRTPPVLFSIGEWYDNFEQLDDVTVCRLLQRAAETAPEQPAQDQPG